jgi:transcriptional regulator with XRE-family HTH domain
MKDIRRQLDLSLTEMAELLGVKKSTFAKYEQGQRPLPTTGRTLMERLAMELYLPKERPTNASAPDPLIEIRQQENAMAEKYLTNLVRNATLAILKAEKQLDKLRDTYNRQALLLQIITALKNADAATEPATTAQTKWLAQEIICKRKLKASGFYQQMLLQIEIDNKRNELNAATKILESLTNRPAK